MKDALDEDTCEFEETLRGSSEMGILESLDDCNTDEVDLERPC